MKKSTYFLLTALVATPFANANAKTQKNQIVYLSEPNTAIIGVSGAYNDMHQDPNNEVSNYAGGVYYFKGDTLDKDATPLSIHIDNATFANNRAEAPNYLVYGGVIGIGGRAELTINNSTFQGNSADGAGGAIFHATPAKAGVPYADLVRNLVNINNTSFINNSSDLLSGGAISTQDFMNISGSVFTGNTALKNGGVRLLCNLIQS